MYRKSRGRLVLSSCQRCRRCVRIQAASTASLAAASNRRPRRPAHLVHTTTHPVLLTPLLHCAPCLPPSLTHSLPLSLTHSLTHSLLGTPPAPPLPTLQEMPDEVPPGSTPRCISVHLRGDITRSLKAGDSVTLGGVFLPEPFTGWRALRWVYRLQFN